MVYKFINTEYLEMVTGKDRVITAELAGIFFQQVDEFYSAMKSFNNSGSYSELGQIAHKAKSSVAIMGMERLAGMLKQLELDAKTGINSEGYHIVLTTFREDTFEAVKELKDYLVNL
jgi:HPt (histidine-containing phosphotransfer) domain-containing protein